MQSVLGRFVATTVSTAAIALLLPLQSQSVEAESTVDVARVERLQSLLVEHDVRYALHAYAKSSGDCTHGGVERRR